MEKQPWVLVAAVAAVLVVGTAISQPTVEAAPAPSLLCGMTQNGLEACQPAVTTKLQAPPSPACCAALARADLSCLCAFKNKNKDLLKSLKIDPGLATQLPTKCHLTPPSKC